MPTDRLVIAADHAGYELKSRLIELLTSWGHQVTDLGTQGPQSVDYPDYAARLVKRILQEKGSKGILICGSGIGMCMSANRFKGIRAALCTSAYMATMARAHNNANVLCLGSRVISIGDAESILDVFLKTEFEAGRHAIRIKQIESILEQENP
jgi:ribose 5-phosphate isomerase B